MRALDLGVLLACATGIFIASQNEGALDYVLVWHHPLDAAPRSAAGAEAGAWVRLPPLVRDLDGDGGAEIIVATHQAQLRVLQMQMHGGGSEEAPARRLAAQQTRGMAGKASSPAHIDQLSLVDPEWATVRVLAEVDMSDKGDSGGHRLKMRSGRRAVAIDTGYIDAYSADSPRSQVIVAVTEGCKVICYTSQLELLWTESLQCDLASDRVQDVSLFVTSHSVRREDRGLIVVGARRLPKDGPGSTARHQDGGDIDGPEEEEQTESLNSEDAAIDAARRHMDEAGKDAGGYFFQAFEGGTGDLRWSLDVGDFEPELDPSDDLTPMSIPREHKGELPWQAFRSSFLLQLPHAWFSPGDASIDLAHFVKRRSGKSGAEKQQRRIAKSHELMHQIPGSELVHTRDMVLPHRESEHVKEPNVLVAHLRGGVQAMHLYTGRPVARMTLKPAAVHCDVNADGAVDHVDAIAGWVTPWYSGRGLLVPKHIPPLLPRCMALVTSGVPPRKRLFNASVCPRDARRAARYRRRSRRFAAFSEKLRESLTVTRPALLRRSSRKRKASRGGHSYDMVFAISSGEVTSVAPDGSRNWQVETRAGWPSQEKHFHSHEAAEQTGHFEDQDPFMPSATAFHLRQEDMHQYVLMLGHSSMVLLSEHGSVKATVELDEPPVAPPVFGDFSRDGFDDAIVITEKGIYGFVLQRRLATHLFSFLLGTVLLSLVVALLCGNADAAAHTA